MDQRRGIFRHAITASFNPFLPSSIGIKMRGSLDMVQRLKLETRLKIHDGCVNTICWNERGDLLLSGSDDHHLCVSNPFSKKVVHSIHSGHRANIFSAKFLPNTQDKHIVSCSGDGMIYFTDLEAFEVTGASNSFDCHNGTTAYEVLTVPQDPHSFLSCGEDGTVRWFDLRIKDKCSKSECKEDVLIHCRRAITAISINPLLPYQLAVGCSDSSVRVFDRRMLGTRATGNYTGRGITGMVSRFCAPSVEKRPHRITSLEYSPDGEEVLLSYSSEHLYLFNIREDHTKDKVLKKEAEPSSSRQPAEDGAEGGEGSNNKQQPPVKKLRLRGDWSDTGPDARPESERGSTEQGSSNIMQRMSDMLTRWFEGINRQQDENSPQGREGEGQSQREPESEEGGEQNQEGAASATQNDAEDKKDDSEGKKDGSDEKPEDEKQKDGVEKELGATCDSKSDVNDLGQSVPKLSLEVADAARGLVTLESDSSASAGTMSSSIKESQSPTSGQSIPTSPKEMPEQSSDSCQAVAAGMAPCASPMETDQTMSQSSQKPCEAMDLSTDSISVPTSQDCDNAPCDPNQSHDTSDSQRSRTSQDDTGADTGQEGAAGEESGEGASADSLVNQPHASRFLIVPSGVRNVEQHLQQQEYTPVISLHYCAAGTSTSTIKVDFTALNQRQAADVANQSSVLHIQRPAGGATTRLTPSPLDSGPPGQPPVTQISEGQGEGQGQGRDEQVQGDQGQVGPAEDISPSSSAERKDDAPRETALETSETTQETGDIKTDSSSTVQESGQQNIRVLSRPVPSISIEHDSSMPSENDEPSAGEPMDTGSGPNSVAAEQNNEETDAAGASSTSSSAKPDPPTRSQAGSSGRQRRHGHSGPPTGNFQLHSGSGSSDDDSDTEATPEPPRTRGAATGLDRHLAAVRLQQLYRRRQEQLEKEEQGLNNVHQPRIKQCYRGHRNARTMIKEANFWGERYVMSGSDCGHIFIWDRYTSRLEMLLEADRHVVNCLQPHPVYPVLASSGIDYDVKLWMPTAAENQYNISVADEVIKRNQVMLEETRDTITVPASFMLRMLASLNHLRTGRRAFAGDRESNSDSTDDDH